MTIKNQHLDYSNKTPKDFRAVIHFLAGNYQLQGLCNSGRNWLKKPQLLAGKMRKRLKKIPNRPKKIFLSLVKAEPQEQVDQGTGWKDSKKQKTGPLAQKGPVFLG
jgi:hypothetical protein